jgi:alkylated DNA repair dioxygenase AlkB
MFNINNKITLIKTNTSELNVYDCTTLFDTNTIIEDCVKDVKSTLIIKPPIKVYGKLANQQRNVGFYSDEADGYKYSTYFSKSIPLSSNLKLLLVKINDAFNTQYNAILINEYEDGNQYIGAHSDNEENLSPKAGVISLSYGASRKFRTRDKKTKNIVSDFNTQNNQIVQMKGNFQNEFTHEIPKQLKIKNTRYSFTFREHLS